MYNNQIKNDIKEMKNVLQKYLNKAGVSMNNGKKLQNMSNDEIREAYRFLYRFLKESKGGKRHARRTRHARRAHRNKSHKRR